MPNPATFNLLVLRTPDLERLRAFYTTLGISFTQEQHGTGPVHFAGPAGPILLELYPLPAGTVLDEHLPRLGFTVPDLATTMDALLAADIVIDKPPRMKPWGLRAEVRDPDGRVVELSQS